MAKTLLVFVIIFGKYFTKVFDSYFEKNWQKFWQATERTMSITCIIPLRGKQIRLAASFWIIGTGQILLTARWFCMAIIWRMVVCSVIWRSLGMLGFRRSIKLPISIYRKKLCIWRWQSAKECPLEMQYMIWIYGMSLGISQK